MPTDLAAGVHLIVSDRFARWNSATQRASGLRKIRPRKGIASRV